MNDNMKPKTVTLRSPKNLQSYQEVALWCSTQLRRWKSYRNQGWSRVLECGMNFHTKKELWSGFIKVEIRLNNLFNSY